MWLLLAFLCAFFTSLQDVFGKLIIKKVDVHVIAWGWVVGTLPFFYIYLIIEGIPPIGPRFPTALIVSTVVITLASILYFKAIKYSDLSVTMPLLTFTPLFLLVTSPLIVGEFPGPVGIAGIIFIVAGAYVLHFNRSRPGYLEPFKHLIYDKGSRYMLGVAIIYSIGANYDKVGVIHSSPVAWLAALNTLVAVILWCVMCRQTDQVWSQIRSVWPILLLLGFLNALALIFQMISLKLTLVPYMIAIKRTSAFMTSLFGFLLFKERGMRERLIGAGLMIIGVFLISFFQ